MGDMNRYDGLTSESHFFNFIVLITMEKVEEESRNSYDGYHGGTIERL